MWAPLWMAHPNMKYINVLWLIFNRVFIEGVEFSLSRRRSSSSFIEKASAFEVIDHLKSECESNWVNVIKNYLYLNNKTALLFNVSMFISKAPAALKAAPKNRFINWLDAFAWKQVIDKLFPRLHATATIETPQKYERQKFWVVDCLDCMARFSLNCR